MDNYSPDEYESRIKLACAYRICAYMKWDEIIYNHLTARIPGTNEILLNPFGLRFDEITASSLIKVDLEGNVLDQGSTDYPLNKAGVVLHLAIHKSRPDIISTMHTHSNAGVAVACMKDGLLPISQNSFFMKNIKYHDYESITIDVDEQERIVKDLGDSNVMILRNHGLLTGGKTIEEAFANLFQLTKACEIQLQILSAVGGDQSKLLIPTETIQEKTFNIHTKTLSNGFYGVNEFNALRRLMEKIDNSFLN